MSKRQYCVVILQNCIDPGTVGLEFVNAVGAYKARQYHLFCRWLLVNGIVVLYRRTTDPSLSFPLPPTFDHLHVPCFLLPDEHGLCEG
jgi:hypothetical protein